MDTEKSTSSTSREDLVRLPQRAVRVGSRSPISMDSPRGWMGYLALFIAAEGSPEIRRRKAGLTESEQSSSTGATIKPGNSA